MSEGGCEWVRNEEERSWKSKADSAERPRDSKTLGKEPGCVAPARTCHKYLWSRAVTQADGRDPERTQCRFQVHPSPVRSWTKPGGREMVAWPGMGLGCARLALMVMHPSPHPPGCLAAGWTKDQLSPGVFSAVVCTYVRAYRFRKYSAGMGRGQPKIHTVIMRSGTVNPFDEQVISPYGAQSRTGHSTSGLQSSERLLPPHCTTVH
jgi:hypothetical protein